MSGYDKLLDTAGDIVNNATNNTLETMGFADNVNNNTFEAAEGLLGNASVTQTLDAAREAGAAYTAGVDKTIGVVGKINGLNIPVDEATGFFREYMERYDEIYQAIVTKGYCSFNQNNTSVIYNNVVYNNLTEFLHGVNDSVYAQLCNRSAFIPTLPPEKYGFLDVFNDFIGFFYDAGAALIVDISPYTALACIVFGVGIGYSVRGKVHKRRDLDHSLGKPRKKRRIFSKKTEVPTPVVNWPESPDILRLVTSEEETSEEQPKDQF